MFVMKCICSLKKESVYKQSELSSIKKNYKITYSLCNVQTIMNKTIYCYKMRYLWQFIILLKSMHKIIKDFVRY